MWQYNYASSTELYHYGVKGMKWGVVKERPKSTNKRGYKIHGDGRIEIEKGTELQRLVGKRNKQDLSGMTYASFTKNDNNKYIQVLGGKGILGGGRDTKLTLKATTKLKSPSVQEASSTFFKLLKDNPDLNEAYSKTPFMSMMGKKYSDKDLDKLIEKSKSGKNLDDYTMANSSLMFDDMSNVRDAYFSKLKEQGYNMLRDENDVSTGYAKNPIILLDASSTTMLETRTLITDQMRKDAKSFNKEQKKKVKQWMKENGFKTDPLLE